ncbi:hypothetical protein niasHT_040181 [Heterodera trifolii]|uniref:Uncharacterized protein n=1 Tax=Heterodera trifolii TaxID=157864 RepID=A0ABD2I985_9BILA
MDKSDMEIMPQMGLGNEGVTECENRITVHLDNNSSREWVLEFKNMGENGLKIIGKGKFKAVLNFVCLAICTLALLNGVHGMDRQPNGQKVPSESADDFEDFEMQQWQSELRDLQQIETAESTSGLNMVAVNTGIINQEVSPVTDTVPGVPISESDHQVRGIIENPIVNTNVQCVGEKTGTTGQLPIPTNLDLLNWAQIHRFLPPPKIMLKVQQLPPNVPLDQQPTTAANNIGNPNVPLDQRPSTSANNIGNSNVSASYAPSCSSIQCGKYGKAIRNWDGRVARPVPTDSCRRERAAPYFRPRPIQSMQQQQPRTPLTNLPFPIEFIPPIHVPSAIRREFLRRMSQETDHFFGLAQLVGEWNPTLATLFLSLETFCRAILQLCVNEGSDHPAFSRPECRRR